MTAGQAEPADLSLLSGLAPELATAFVSLSSDIALVIDEQGVIRNVAVGQSGPGSSASAWVGQPWVETVTGETRRKIELLLQEAGSAGVTRRREVNHPASGGPDIPISYAAMRLGAHGPVIAVGRDLRAVSAIQQRLVDAQQELEREYWNLRQAQTRQRLLSQVASDAVLVVDGQSGEVLLANAAALALFGAPAGPLPAPIDELLAMASQTGRAAEVRTRLGLGAAAPQIDLSATPFRAPAQGPEGAQRLLVRARQAAADGLAGGDGAVVITDSSGRVLMSNAAFATLCRGVSDTQISGRPLAELLGDPQRHLAGLLVEVRRDGLAVRPAARLGGGMSPSYETDIAAALLADGEQECIGLTLGPVAPAQPGAELGAALQALVEQVGRMPLDALMRHAAEAIERHAIDTALRRSDADLDDAAELLGIDTDDLDQRLRRLQPAERGT